MHAKTAPAGKEKVEKELKLKMMKIKVELEVGGETVAKISFQHVVSWAVPIMSKLGFHQRDKKGFFLSYNVDDGVFLVLSFGCHLVIPHRIVSRVISQNRAS